MPGQASLTGPPGWTHPADRAGRTSPGGRGRSRKARGP